MKGSSPAFTCKHDRIVPSLQTLVSVKAFEDEKNFSESPKFIATWDTGATGSTITEKVVDAIGLKGKHVKRMTMTTPSGQKEVPCYVVSILLPNHVEIKQALVMEEIHHAHVIAE